MQFISPTLDILKNVFLVVISFWWIYSPILLCLILYETYQTYTQTKYLSSLNWVLIELKVPKDIHKTPKAMENVFSAFHVISSKIKWRDKFFKGKVLDWFSFEIVGFQGQIRFFIRTLAQYQGFIQSQIYAQFPEVEIIIADDYLDRLPQSLPNNQYDLWAAELVFNKDSAYPIKTYPAFEEGPGAGKDDAKRSDPLASISEVITTLNPSEFMIFQIVVKPAGDQWTKDGGAVVDKIMGKPPKIESGKLSNLIFSVESLLPGAYSPPKEEKKDQKEQLSPGKQDILKAIENKIGKLGFEGGLRIMYIGAKDNFNRAHISAMNGALKQFASHNLNGFKANGLTTPSGRWPFKAQQEYNKKVWMYSKTRKRSIVEQSIILNTEELATLFHFPDVTIRSPSLPRIETKKSEPPADLPIG